MTALTNPGLADPLAPTVEWTQLPADFLSRLKLGYYEDDGSIIPSPAIRRVLREAAAVLADRGAQIIPFSVPEISRLKMSCDRIFGADGGSAARKFLRESELDWRIERILSNASGRTTSLYTEKYFETVADLRAYRQTFLSILDDLDIEGIICPPSALPAITHGACLELEAPESYTLLFNAIGLPAGVVAASRVRRGEETDRPGEGPERSIEEGSVGLPVGVQVAAKPWRDEIVLAVMEALEQHFARDKDYPRDSPL
jgi:fatty acid amide hydrolase